MKVYDDKGYPGQPKETILFFLKLKEGYPGWPKSRGILPRITLEIKTIV